MAEKESTSETVLQVNSLIRGYHEYQEIWRPEIGDEYELKQEPLNTVDHNAVAIVRKREGGRYRRESIHENGPMAYKIPQEANKQRKSCCEREARKQRGRLWFRNSMGVQLQRRRVLNSMVKIKT